MTQSMVSAVADVVTDSLDMNSPLLPEKDCDQLRIIVDVEDTKPNHVESQSRKSFGSSDQPRVNSLRIRQLGDLSEKEGRTEIPEEAKDILGECGQEWELLSEDQQNLLHSLLVQPVLVELDIDVNLKNEPTYYECTPLLTVDYIKSEIFHLNPSLSDSLSLFFLSFLFFQ